MPHTCIGCGNKDVIKTSIKYDAKLEVSIETCDLCGSGGFGMTAYRDADGNKVVMPTEMLGRYSYAIDDVIRSKRQFADILKRNNLVQRGGNDRRQI